MTINEDFVKDKDIVNDDEHYNEDDTDKIAQYFLDAIEFEYEHSIHRPERLDNKIYISLAVYAFLAVLLTNSFVICKENCILSGVYYVILVIVIILFTVTLLSLIHLLKADQIAHYNLEALIDDDGGFTLDTEDKVCRSYADYAIHNNKLLDEKNKKFNMCMSFTFFVVVGVVVLNYIAKYLK